MAMLCRVDDFRCTYHTTVTTDMTVSPRTPTNQQDTPSTRGHRDLTAEGTTSWESSPTRIGWQR